MEIMGPRTGNPTMRKAFLFSEDNRVYVIYWLCTEKLLPGTNDRLWPSLQMVVSVLPSPVKRRER